MMSALGARVRNQGLSTLVIRAGGMGMLFLMHTVLAQFVGSEPYGTFSFAIVFAALVSKVSSLGWPTALVRFMSEYLEMKRWSLLRGVIQRTHQVSLMASLSAALLIGLFSVLLPVRPELRQGLQFAALLTPLLTLVSVRRNAFQGLHRNLASVLPDEVLIPALVILGCFLSGPVGASDAVLLYAGASLMAFVVASVWLSRSLPVEARDTRATFRSREWMRTALPMALGGLSFLVLSRTDSLMLGMMRDMKTVGLYSAANRYAVLITIVLGSITIVTSPMLSAAHYGGRRLEFYSLFRWSRLWALLGALPLLIAMELFPEQLLGLFGEQFTGGATLLRILAFGQFISVSVGPVGQGLLMTGNQQVTAYLTALVALGNAVGNAVVIPLWGGIGAAWVSVVSVAVLNGALWRSLVRRIPPPDFHNGKTQTV